jgi:hypothetical protein
MSSSFVWKYPGFPNAAERAIDMRDMKLMRLDWGHSLDARASRLHARHLEEGMLRV